MRDAWLKILSRRKWTREEHINRSDVLHALPVISAVLLAGCSLAPFISSNSIDYNNTVENVTNNVLVTNILRARDQAPLYFSDLALIRGAMEFNVQAQTTIPYGELYKATTRATGQAGPIAINSKPGFDLAPLNTKKFAQGMLRGIDIDIFAYFIQRRVNPKIFLNLVVSRVERYAKSPNGRYNWSTCIYSNPCFDELIKSWTNDRTLLPIIGQISSASGVGPVIPADKLLDQKNLLGNLIDADAAKLKLIKSQNNFQLLSTKENYVLCVRNDGGYEAVGIASPGATKAPTKPPIPTSNGNCSSYSPRLARLHHYVIYLRSVESIFYYLGEITKKPYPPLAFRIYDYPVEGARFSTDYRGVSYYVREYSDDDQTIAILAILNDLLNLNRDAEEIPSTKTVATTP